MDSSDSKESEELSPPQGRNISHVERLLTTWTGRILIANTIIFLVMWWDGGSLFVPSEEILIKYGAKYSFGLVRGEFWRIFTPMWVHIGLIHFGLNSLALYFVGSYVERTIGSKWFLAIYLLSGIFAGAASGAITMGMSAGASGAIFGIIGVGFVFERLIFRQIYQSTGRRPRKGPFTGLVIANIVLGFILTTGPVRIDNAAHIGGLIAGILLTFVMLFSTSNRLLPTNHSLAGLLGVLFVGFTAVGCFLASDGDFLRSRILERAKEDSNPQAAFNALTEGVKTFPEDTEFRFLRGRLLIKDGQAKLAFEEFDHVLGDSSYHGRMLALLEELATDKKSMKEYLALRSYLLERLGPMSEAL